MIKERLPVLKRTTPFYAFKKCNEWQRGDLAAITVVATQHNRSFLIEEPRRTSFFTSCWHESKLSSLVDARNNLVINRYQSMQGRARQGNQPDSQGRGWAGAQTLHDGHGTSEFRNLQDLSGRADHWELGKFLWEDPVGRLEVLRSRCGNQVISSHQLPCSWSSCKLC